MLDSQNNVAIETGRPLNPGLYRALVVKVCTTETIQIQVWSGVSSNQYVLKWFTTITPSPSQLGEKGMIVSIANNTLTINNNDRLAIYSPGNAYNKIPVPYTFSSTSTIKLSSKNFNFPFKVSLGETVNLKTSSRPRSFEKFLQFCSSPVSCVLPDYNSGVSPPEISFSKYITMPATCCDPSRLPNCDLTNRTIVILNDQTNVIKVLIDRIRYLQILIKNYVNGVNELGYCENPTYTKGLYGLGHCYKVFNQSVELAEAAIICSADKARLVFIKDTFEDNFIRNMLQKNHGGSSNSVKSWIAAIFGFELEERSWYWYNNLLSGDNFESFGTYVKWLRGQTPVPKDKNDVCASYALNLRTKAYFWQKESCTSKYPFICKIKKLCY